MTGASQLLGAWSRDARPVRQALGAEGIRAMRAALGYAGAPAEADGGAWWMLAAPDKLVSSAAGCTAYEGFIPEGEFHGGEPQPAPDGHYVLARAGASGLTLLRALSGGERLYYLLLDGAVVFASTLRALLAYPGLARRLNRARLRDALVTGLTLSGDATLIEGIDEVPAGHCIRFERNGILRRWHYPGLLEPLEGDPAALAARYREALARAIVACAGRARPVAIALSGGIDSAAVAALAVEAFGAGQVAAYTYEFDDPTHPSETPYAVQACRSLGIARHHVFKLRLDRYLAAIPETVWRAESFVHWPKAFMLEAARRIRDDGHDRFLCGFGIGSHMAYYEDLARLLRWLPASLAAAYWKLAHTRGFRWLDALERAHPALARPNLRVLYLVCGLLGAARRVADPLRCFPREFRPLLDALPAGGGVDEPFRGMDLAAALRHQGFAHLLSCVDVTRWEKPLRELGIHRLSPAHFASTLPYAYLPYRPRPFVWSAERRARPGKHLLRLAVRGRLPDALIDRRKSWADAVVSKAWLAAGRRWMRQACSDPHALFAPRGEAGPRALRRWDARSPQHTVTAAAFWHRLFVERPPSSKAPTWEELASENWG